MEQVDVAVVGAGAAGLSAAYHLTRDGGLDVLLLEQSSRVGGKILTHQEDGFVVEAGPDSFVAARGEVPNLAEALGLDRELVPADSRGVYIYSRGRMRRFPAGLEFMVPTHLGAFLRSDIVSLPAKLRMLADLVLPPRRDDSDESLAAFVRRRLGMEALTRIAEPLIGGIHGTPPEEMSVRAAFPRFYEMERAHGSLIRAALAARRARPRGRPPRPYFLSFRRGMASLPEALAAALPAGTVRLSTGVVALHRDGSGYRLETGQGTVWTRSVILALPAWDAARLVRALDPELSSQLQGIPARDAVTVSLAFREQDVADSVPGTGYLVPRAEGRTILGVTYSSRKFPDRTPAADWALLRCFLGGETAARLAAQGEEALLQAVLDDLRATAGLRSVPARTWVFSWPAGMPQYRVGHLERLSALDTLLARHRGLRLAGASYRGIGIPDCVQSGKVAAQQVAAFLSGSA